MTPPAQQTGPEILEAAVFQIDRPCIEDNRAETAEALEAYITREGPRVQFIDDREQVVQAVTAEQHTLDNPGHVVTLVVVDAVDGLGDFAVLTMVCIDCKWWNQDGFPISK